jgi:hypothetical protein
VGRCKRGRPVRKKIPKRIHARVRQCERSR